MSRRIVCGHMPIVYCVFYKLLGMLLWVTCDVEMQGLRLSSACNPIQTVHIRLDFCACNLGKSSDEIKRLRGLQKMYFVLFLRGTLKWSDPSEQDLTSGAKYFLLSLPRYF